MANPNPQNPKRRYRWKGVKDLGYTRYEKSDDADPMDHLKFGKKVANYDMPTTTQVMHAHLS